MEEIKVFHGKTFLFHRQTFLTFGGRWGPFMYQLSNYILNKYFILLIWMYEKSNTNSTMKKLQSTANDIKNVITLFRPYFYDIRQNITTTMKMNLTNNSRNSAYTTFNLMRFETNSIYNWQLCVCDTAFPAPPICRVDSSGNVR